MRGFLISELNQLIIMKRLNFQSYKAETLYDGEENTLKITTLCVAKLKCTASQVQNEQLLLLLVLVILHFKLKTGQLTHSYKWNMYSINHALNTVTAR
jgi:hypothetical protein